MISFEPSAKSIKLFIFWAIVQFVAYILYKDLAAFIVLLGIMVAFFIWVESVCYPYGVKYLDEN